MFSEKGIRPTKKISDKTTEAVKIAKDVADGAVHFTKIAAKGLVSEALTRAKASRVGRMIQEGLVEEEEPLKFGDYSGASVEKLNQERLERNARRGLVKGPDGLLLKQNSGGLVSSDQGEATVANQPVERAIETSVKPTRQPRAERAHFDQDAGAA